jgi:hypothetical protein
MRTRETFERYQGFLQLRPLLPEFFNNFFYVHVLMVVEY